MRNAVILIANLIYIKYAKYLINNIKDKNKDNDFDIVVITNDEDFIQVQNQLKNYPVIIRSVDNENNIFYLKYHIFDEYFKQWENILYLDCDTIILGDINNLFNLTNTTHQMFANFEPWEIIRYFDSYCPQTEDNFKDYESLLKEKSINSKGFNTGILLYNSSIISKETTHEIYKYHEKYQKINKHTGNGTDQPIINLVFQEKCKEIPNNYFAYWEAYNQNSLILHFTHWHAPWFNERFNEKINEKYVDYCDKIFNKINFE